MPYSEARNMTANLESRGTKLTPVSRSFVVLRARVLQGTTATTSAATFATASVVIAAMLLLKMMMTMTLFLTLTLI